MKFTTFIAENAKWNINKNPFAYLWAQPTTREMLNEQLRALGERYFVERKGINTLQTEFCLNHLALKKPQTECQIEVLRHFDDIWQTFLRLKNIFARNITFPSNDTTRLEQVAALIAKCTGFLVDDEMLKDILHDCQYLVNLTEREVEYLPRVVELYKINYFCALAREVFDKNKLAEMCFAQLVSWSDVQLFPTTHYGQASYKCGNLLAVCDVLGNSMLSMQQKVEFCHKMLIYKCGRNIFDTFCMHSFLQNCGHFGSNISRGKVAQRYFLQDGCEIRNTTLTHQGKSRCKFLVDLPVECDGERLATTDNTLCFATAHHYIGFAVICQKQGVRYKVGTEGLTMQFYLMPNEQIVFDVVTIVGQSYQEVATKLAKLHYFGATRPATFGGEPLQIDYTSPLNLTSASNCFAVARQQQAKKLNFTYQLGSDDVATFLDNGGNGTTLLKGFVFGVGGEKVYAVNNGHFSHINCGSFTLDGKVCYNKPTSSCIISHNEGKNIAINHHVPQKTVFYFPFERTSQMVFVNNTFVIDDGLRKYKIACCGRVESYTTDGLEFSTYRLRYKFSGNLTAGNCLAICFEKDFQCGVCITSQQCTPPMSPLVQESLVSTYLNYVNGKEVFCLNNYLKRPQPLALAAIVYTNAQFVKQYLQKLWQNLSKTFYYDNCGKWQKCQSEFLFDLATIYYATLVNDNTFPSAEIKKYVNTHLLSVSCSGTDMVLQALCLKKAAQVQGFDKVKCLVNFAKLTKEIAKSNKLSMLAQAVGITPLKHPSKQYLKEVCLQLEMPKNWYYVSQLENLYGLHIVGASLQVTPTAFADKLEEFALNFGGKRIYTTFNKCAMQAMTLNGCQYHQPFDPYTLANDKNTLVISY